MNRRSMNGRNILVFILSFLVAVHAVLLYSFFNFSNNRVVESNSSLEELDRFLRFNPVDLFVYRPDFDCVEFSKALNRDLEANGFEAGFVLIEYKKGGHAIVSVKLNDSTVFVEPQTDRVYRSFSDFRNNTDREVVDRTVVW